MERSMISKAKGLNLLLAAAICMVSCSKQALPEEPVAPSDTDRIQFCISASCSETKTAMSGKSVVWESDDDLAVTYQHGGQRETAVFAYNGGNSFVGEITTPDDPCDWYAIYPSSAASGTGVSLSLPAESIQQGNGSMAHLAGDGFPLWGKALEVPGSDIPHMQMEQLASVISFNVTNQEDSPITISRVLFTAPVEIAGEFSGSMTAAEWTPVPGKATKTAALDIQNGEEITPGGSASFYMGVMPFSATGDYNITVLAECGGRQIYSTKNVQGKTMSFSAGVVGKINYKFISSIPEEAKSYYVKVTSNPGATNWGGTYLIVNTDKGQAFSTAGGKAGTCAVTDKDGRIESNSDTDRCAVTISGGTQKHRQGATKDTRAYDIKNSEGNFVYFNSGGLRISSSNSENGGTYQHAIDLDGNGIQLMSAKNGGSGGGKYYMTYTGGSFTYNSTDGNRILLYRKDNAPSKPGQTLQFAESRIVWNVGESGDHLTGATYNLPQTATGAMTYVTYSSSDPSVAEIVGNSQIRINGTGTATITATAAESAEYNSANASFTLSIREPGVITEDDLGTFELVNDYYRQYLLEAAGKYAADGSDWSTYSVVTNYTAGSTTKAFDRPNPVKIPVDMAEGSKVTVEVYNNSSRTDVELVREYTVSGGNAEVYNLIPNQTYWYTVVDEGEDISYGTFKTTGLRRQIKVGDRLSQNHANNLRDFGGQKTVDGKTLRYNLLFRGSNMDSTTPEEQDWIINYLGVKRDVDLRGSDARRPLDANIVEYTNGNINSYSDMTVEKLRTVFSGIATSLSKGEACYIHCAVGADRTGYICMVLNAICGVSKKDCTIDYELTSFSCVGRRARNTSNYDYNFRVLQNIERQSGSTFQEQAQNYLLSVGVTQAQINTIVNAMVAE